MLIRILRRPLLIFAVLTTVLLGAAFGFLQSRTFAGMVRRFLEKSVPPELGISGNFREFGIQLFPPAVTISEPELKLAPENLFSLPADSVIKAKQIGVSFKPLQMLTGHVELSEARIVGGDLELKITSTQAKALKASRKKERSTLLDWEKLVQIQIRAIALEDSRVLLEWSDSGAKLILATREVVLARTGSPGSFALALDGALDSVEFKSPSSQKGPSRVSDLEAHAVIYPDRVDVSGLSVDFGKEGFEFVSQASGKIKGSVLDFESLQADLKISASGQLSSIAAWSGLSKAKLRGGLSFEGQLQTDLLNPRKSLRLAGKTELRDTTLEGWAFKRADLDGLFELSSNGSESRAVLERGRIELAQGHLELGRIVWHPHADETLKIPVRLESVELSPLLGPHASTLESLATRLSGALDVELNPKSKNFRILTQARLSAPSLSLFGGSSRRDQNLILRTKSVQINGTFLVERSRFSPLELELGFGSSRFKVGGGVTWGSISQAGSPEIQWDLGVGGSADLSDLESLGRSQIRGKGGLQARIHGGRNSLALEFDADLQEAEYVQLQFGKIKGRITLSDDLKLLSFHRVDARNGTSSYQVDGSIDFRGDGKMALGFDMPNGRIEDFSRILSPLTRQLPWFPHLLRGRTRIRGSVGGALSVQGMDIQAQLDGSNWSYLGEQLSAVKFRGGYQAGRYWAEDLVAIKRSGSILGKVSFGPEGKLAWRLRTQNLSLRDFDWIIRLDVPVSGDLSIQSEGSGKWQQLESTTQLRLVGAAIRGKSLAESSLSVQSKQGAFNAEGAGLGGQLKIVAQHDPASHSSNRFSLVANNLDLSSALILLNPKLANEDELGARVSGEVNLSYRGSAIDLASGTVSLSELRLKKQGASFKLLDPVSSRLDSGTFDLPAIRVSSASGQIVAAQLGARRGNWSTHLSGDLDLSFLEFVAAPVLQAGGRVNLDFNLSGAFWSPELSGAAEVDSGRIRINSLDSPIENLSGRISVRKNKWLFTSFQADLAQGRVSGGGQVLLYTDRLPELDFAISLAENRLKAYPFQYLKVGEGKITLTGKQLPYEISGSVVVDEAISREKLSNAGQGIALKTTLYAPPASPDSSLDFPLVILKLDVKADSGLRFQNEFLDVELKAAITLVNTLEAPRVLGRAELVPGQGKLNFKEHVFQIQSAQVIFDNPQSLDPRFELGAVTEVGGTKIQLFTSGTAGRYKIDLSSNPVMPESEILSLLTLGRTTEDSRRLRSTNVSGIQQSEAASLILHSMDFNRDVKEKTGFQIGVGEALDTMQGASAFRPQADAESTVAPKIVLKRQIGKQVDLSVGSTVGAGATTQREVNADLYLSPSVSVRGVWNYLEGTSTQDAGASQQGRTSFGLDLKLQKRFK
jgi:hypothetical protein